MQSVVTGQQLLKTKKKSASERNGGEVAQKIRAYRLDNKRKLKPFIAGFGTPKWSK